MGPPPFGDGKNESGWEIYGNALLQWGHRLSAMERDCWALMWMTLRSCFNGATAFRRWKEVKSDGQLEVGAGFNGATAFRRWKAGTTRSAICLPVSLQWGHRLSAMESWGVESTLPSLCNASMGPPPFGDGKLGCPLLTKRRFKRFNGATAFRRWKGVGGQRVVCPDHRASMGPPPFGDGKKDNRLRVPPGKTASMGPPPFGDGKSERSHPRRPGWPRFNGATAFRRWKAPTGAPRRHAWPALQWGHRLSAMGSGENLPCDRCGLMTLQWGHRLSAMESSSYEEETPTVWSLQWGHRLSAMERRRPRSG